MTLVIASRCKDGVVVASDGYGIGYVPGRGNTNQVFSDTKKIIDFEKCCLLAFGAGARDYDEFFKDFNILLDGPIDYEFCRDKLGGFLYKKYYDALGIVESNIGIILAGVDKRGNSHINVFTSKSDFQPGTPMRDFICAGRPKLANAIFKAIPNLAEQSADTVALFARKAIEETSKLPNSDVNDNVTLKLIDKDGIHILK